MKRENSRKSSAIIIVLLAVMLPLGVVFAQVTDEPVPPAPPVPPCPKGMGPGGMVGTLMDLDLSDKQIGKVVDIRAACMRDQIPLKRELRALSEERDALSDDELNRDNLEQLYEKMARIRARLEVNRVEAQKKALGVLTKEQREALGDHPLPLFGGRYHQKCGMGYGHGKDSKGPGHHKPKRKQVR